MHVKIQGGGDGVYANSGSCSAAAMYCEHERQALIKKGMKPETFFNQQAEFVSTREVIENIDNNKKHLRKEDAKFFVLTISPSADEQKKMGEKTEDRINAFKKYIRKGIMEQYADNFERGLTANDIMYYAYVHVNRGDKEGEQMHAHIIVSRRDMKNSISLSPKSNHRKGKGVIAHGFNRDHFNKKCEKTFDEMMGYNRKIDESYEYRNSMKNGSYEDIAKVTTKAIRQKYGVISTSWDDLANATFSKHSKSETKAPDFGTISTETPAPQTAISQTKVSEHQSTGSDILGLAKKVWNYATGLFSKKTDITKEKPETTTVTSVKEESNQQFTTPKRNVKKVDVYKNNIGQFVLYMDKEGKYRSFDNIDALDAFKYEQAKKSGDSVQFNEVCIYLEDKYLKDIPAKSILERKQQQTITRKQKVVQPEQRKIVDGLRIFPSKEGYSAAIFNNGKRCSSVVKVDKEDAATFFKAEKSSDKIYKKKIFSEISAKYFYRSLAYQVSKEFNKNNTEANKKFVRMQRGNTGYCSILYKVDGDSSSRYKISDNLSRQINSLPESEIPIVIDVVNNILVNALSIQAAAGSGISKSKDDEKKKKGLKR